MKDRGQIKTYWFNLLLTLGLTILGIAVSVVLAFVTFNQEALLDVGFWILTFGNTVLSLFTFYVYRFSNIKNTKAKDKSYRKLTMVHSRMIDFIHGNKLEDKLHSAVERRNDKEKIEAYTNALYSVTGIFKLNEVYNPSEPEKQLDKAQIIERCDKNFVSAKDKKRLIKLIERMKAGKVEAVRYTDHVIMTTPQAEYTSKRVDENMERGIIAKELTTRLIMFFLFSALMASVKWTGNPADLIKEIVLRLSLFASSMLSALWSTYAYIERRKERIKIKIDIISTVDEIDYTKINSEVINLLTNDGE